MTTTVHVARAEDGAADCARMMRDRNIGFLPVIDPSGHPIGVLTDRDLVTRLLAAGLPHDTRVADVMSRHLVCCGLDEDLRRAQTRMVEGQVSRLVVVEPSGRCVGVLSLADIARVEDCHESGSTLRAILLRESHGPPTLG